MQMKREHLFPLDFVRVLAAVSIVVFHYNAVTFMEPIVNKPILLFFNYANGSMGHIGVSLFFILAGASLMYSSMEKLDLKTYFKKRFLAIYPLYWTVYAAFFVYNYLIKHNFAFDKPLSRLLLTAVGMDGYLNYLIPNYYLLGEWFIGCILLIYLMFPVLRACMLRWPALTLVGTALIYIPLTLFYPFQMDIQFFFLLRVPEVLFGMYFIKYLYGTRQQREKYDWKWGLVSFIGVFTVMTVKTSLPVPFKILWTGIPLFLFLVWVGQFIKNTVVKKGISNFSSYTFAIYLVHHILVGKFVFPLIGRPVGRVENYLVFWKYFVFISITGAVFYWLSRILTGIAALLWGSTVSWLNCRKDTPER